MLRSVSRAVCRMSTAAAWSTTARCRLPATPLSRSVRCASTLVSRSSTRRTQTGAMRAATTAAYCARPRRGGPFVPGERPGQPDHDPDRRVLQHQRGDRLDVGVARGRVALARCGRSVATGVARMPSGSLTATPTRTDAHVDAEPHTALAAGPASAGELPDAPLDRRERLADLRRVLAAALGDVVLAAAAAAERRGRHPHQLAGPDAARPRRLVGAPRRRPAGPWPRR